MYIANLERWDAQLKGWVELERRCQDLMLELLSEIQEVPAGMVVSMRDMQKEAKSTKRKYSRNSRSQRSKGQKEALELVQKKHMLIKWEEEMERAKILQILGGLRAIRHWNDARSVMFVESCSSSVAWKMQDKETTSEASWTAVTKGKEKEVWRLEPEGQAETPEVPWNGAEGVSVNPEGESRHGQVRAEITRKERETQTKMVEKVKEKALGEEGAGTQSPKRKVIWVECEETQDYVRNSLNLSRDEAEEISFVPSAISIPRRIMFWCDNRCRDKAFRFGQFASVVIHDGVESHTPNLCQQCYNENLVAQSLAPLKNCQWKAVVEKKAHRGRLWRMLGQDQYIQGMWEYFFLERARAKKFMKDAQTRKTGRDTRPNGNVSLLPKNT